MRMMDELKHLFLYSSKKKVYVPIDEMDKRKNSAVLLLSPNTETSIQLTKMPYLYNPNLFKSYYIDRNVDAYIKSVDPEVLDFDEQEEEILSESLFSNDNVKFKIEDDTSYVDRKCIDAVYTKNIVKEYKNLFGLKHLPSEINIKVYPNKGALKKDAPDKVTKFYKDGLYSYSIKGTIHLISKMTYDERRLGPYNKYLLTELITYLICNDNNKIPIHIGKAIGYVFSGLYDWIKDDDNDPDIYIPKSIEEIEGIFAELKEMEEYGVIKKFIKTANIRVLGDYYKRSFFKPNKDDMFMEGELSYFERQRLLPSEFGVPDKRKYPMPDKDHVKAAIQMFNKCDPEDEKELADNIIKKIKKFDMADDIHVGASNRFKKYFDKFHESLKETTSLLCMTNDTDYVNEIGFLGKATIGLRIHPHMELWEILKAHKYPGIYNYAKKSKDIDELLYLRQDAYTGIRTYEKIKKLIETSDEWYKDYDLIENDMLKKLKKHNITVKDVDSTIKWFREEYLKLINDRIKELRHNQKMNESYYLESICSEFEQFKTPEELSKWMKTNIHYDSPSTWKLKSPIDTYISKKGNCHDQAYMEKQVFNQMNISNGLLSFIEYNENSPEGGMTHTLLWFKKNGKLYWFENAWDGEQGIHGPYNSIKELKSEIEDLHKNMPSYNKYPDLAWAVPKAKEGMNLGEFINTSFNESAPIDVFNNRSIITEEKSTIDRDFKLKGHKNLSSFKKIHITENVINKYKTKYPYLKNVRCKDTKESICDGYIWIDDDKLVCMVGSCEYTDDHTKWIVSLKIMKEYRGYGLSKQILDYAVKDMNCRYLSVGKNNEVAKSVYDKYGFKVYQKSDTMYFMHYGVLSESAPISDSKYYDILKICDNLSDDEFKRISFYDTYKDSKFVIHRIVRKINDEPVAFLDLYQFPSRPDIAQITLAVDENHRGLGLADGMVKELLNAGLPEKYGFKTFYWTAHENNKASMGLALKNGFIDTKELDKYGRRVFIRPVSVEDNMWNDVPEDLKPNSEDEYTVTENALVSNNMAFFSEVDGSMYSTNLKRYLYKERLKNNKEVLRLYDDVKAQQPYITKTYVKLEMYRKANVFVDLSYYNSLFLKNLNYKLDRGVNFYFEFMNRLINNPTVTSEYKMRTVFIPIDSGVWGTTDPATLWDYRKNVNPISVIFRLLKSNPSLLKKEFGKNNIIFVGSRGYFKIDFKQLDLRDLNRLKKNITKLMSFSEPIEDEYESDDVANDDTEVSYGKKKNNSDSSKAMAMNMIDKIEKGTSIKLNNVSPISQKDNVESTTDNAKPLSHIHLRVTKEPLQFGLGSNKVYDGSTAIISLDPAGSDNFKKLFDRNGVFKNIKNVNTYCIPK